MNMNKCSVAVNGTSIMQNVLHRIAMLRRGLMPVRCTAARHGYKINISHQIDTPKVRMNLHLFYEQVYICPNSLFLITEW